MLGEYLSRTGSAFVAALPGCFVRQKALAGPTRNRKNRKSASRSGSQQARCYREIGFFLVDRPGIDIRFSAMTAIATPKKIASTP